MTTTAHEDQFTADTERHIAQPYDVTAILRQNVADLERELQRQRANFDSLVQIWEGVDNYARKHPEIPLGTSVAEFVLKLMQERDAFAAELKAAREQEPSLVMCGGYEWRTVEDAKHFCRVNHAVHPIRVYYTRPIPAPTPAVPEEWRAAVGAAVGLLENAVCETGVCMCGDAVIGHADFSVGHSACDSGTYHQSALLKQLHALLQSGGWK